MRVLLAFLLIIFMGINSAFGYELVLPKEKKTTVKTNFSFFVGKASKSEEIFINGERIFIAPNGAFAHSVKLKNGENRIIVKSNFATQIYKIYKEDLKNTITPELTELTPQPYIVKKDNTPLRNSPQDFGMNRISHLYKGTNLIINGKKNGFYRVYLSKNKEAWIARDSVEIAKSKIEPRFLNMNSETFKNATQHFIEFTEDLPYTIEENDSEIIFKVYNPFSSKDSVYTINIKKPEKYTYETVLANGKYSFKVKELPKIENDLTIIVDAGHGGSEKGALGCLGDEEKDINLKIAQELKDILVQNGFNVIMTRECDANVSLDDRVKLAKENCSNIFLSIHLNSIPDIKFDIHKNKGTSVYYYNENSKHLAKTVLESITSNLNTRKEGVKTASFAVLRPTEYVGILVEVAYMTNPIDSMLYTKADFAINTANAISDGLLKFLQEDL